MTIQIESDLKEVLGQINQKLDTLSKDVIELRISVVKLEGEIKGDIKALGEKVDGLAKRIDNQEFMSRGVLIGLIVALAGGAAKLFGFSLIPNVV